MTTIIFIFSGIVFANFTNYTFDPTFFSQWIKVGAATSQIFASNVHKTLPTPRFISMGRVFLCRFHTFRIAKNLHFSGFLCCKTYCDGL